MSQLSYVPKYVYTDGSELIDPPVVSAAGKLTVGGLSGLGWYPGSPVAESAAFMTAYKAKEHTAPTLEEAGGYQAVEVLVQALESLPASDINRNAVRNALASKTFSTIYGQVKFAKDGQGTSQVFLIQVEPGLKQQVILPTSPSVPKTITYLGQ
jgi:ABC-type branched-subunit amino acid transport system substrate-binding protein